MFVRLASAATWVVLGQIQVEALVRWRGGVVCEPIARLETKSTIRRRGRRIIVRGSSLQADPHEAARAGCMQKMRQSRGGHALATMPRRCAHRLYVTMCGRQRLESVHASAGGAVLGGEETDAWGAQRVCAKRKAEPLRGVRASLTPMVGDQVEDGLVCEVSCADGESGVQWSAA